MEHKDQIEKAIQVIDKNINDSLTKENITDKLITKYREEYLPLKITSLEDKDTYKRIVEGRKEIKRMRLIGKDLFQQGRAPYETKLQEWKTKEKEITTKFQEIEAILQVEQDKYEAFVEEDKARVAEEKRKHLQERLDQLIAYGAKEVNILDIEHLSDMAFEMQLNSYKEEHERKLKESLLSEERINKITELGLTIDPSIMYGQISEDEFQEFIKEASAEKQRKEEEYARIQRELSEERERQAKLSEENEKHAETLRLEREKIEKEIEQFQNERLTSRISQVEKDLKCKHTEEDSGNYFFETLKTKTAPSVSFSIFQLKTLTNEEFTESINESKVSIKEEIEEIKQKEAQSVAYQQEQELEVKNRELDLKVFQKLLEEQVKPTFEAVSSLQTKSKLGEEVLESIHTKIGEVILLLEHFNK